VTAGSGLIRSIRARLRTADYLRKWVVLGGVIGVISGLGAAAFFLALELATRFFLGVLAGFVPASPVGEGGDPFTEAVRPWAIPMVVGLGGLVSGIIVFRLAPEAEGHGTDAAISAFHHGARRIRSRIPLIKLVASAITIGSGGSAGREGPTAQIGAGFGSLLARVLDLDARDARIAVSCGLGAGIGAIFRAPLGGAVLAAEIPYREDVESEALVPAFVASIISFAIFGALVGYTPIFGRVAGTGFTQPIQLVYYVIIGLVAGLVGRLYIGTFYRTTRWFERWRLPREVRPAIAGFAVGCLGIIVPGALGTGYGWVQASLDRTSLLALPFAMVLVLPFAKIVATSLSIGSGGSGGIFGPGMVIGGLLGASVWRLLEPVAPAIPADPSGFVIVAMMALFGSIAHAPLAVMLMVAEMTDNLGMLGPAMLAVGVASLIVGDRSIYASQLRSRADSPAHQFRHALPLMASIPAGDAARVPRLVLSTTDTVGRARADLLSAGLPGAPVVGPKGGFRGSIELANLGAADPTATLDSLSLDGPVVTVDDGLDDAMSVLAEGHRSWAPVVADTRVIGIVSSNDVLLAYRTALAANVRRVRAVGPTGTLVEADVADASPLAGLRVDQIRWPRDTVLVSITRGDRLIVPRGGVAIHARDRIAVFSSIAARASLDALLGAQRRPQGDEIDGDDSESPPTG
jgi:CIC family chloride channel protein